MRLRDLIAIESWLRLTVERDVARSSNFLRVLRGRRWHHMDWEGSRGLRLDHLLAIY
jgi:hypothetical protein